MCLSQAGIAQSVEHFTRNEGVVSSSLISSLTDRNPLSLKNQRWRIFFVEGTRGSWWMFAREDIGRIDGCQRWDGGRQREIASVRAGTPSGETTRAP